MIPRARILPVVAALAAVAFTVSPRVEAADDDPAPRRGAVLTLLTEHVELDSTPETRFWWKTPESPAWTETDRLLRRQLEDSGVGWVSPDGRSRISRIYRRPELGVDQATALASVLGARRVLVGSVRYTAPGDLRVGQMGVVRARAELKLVTGAVSEPEVDAEWSVQRLAYAGAPRGALETVRDRLASEIVSRVGRSLQSAGGPVGYESDELLIGFVRAGDGRVLSVARRALRSRADVDAVRTRWASEGIVAVELNPARDDSDRAVRRRAESLAGRTVEGVRFSKRTGAEGGLERVVMLAARRTEGNDSGAETTREGADDG